MNAQLKQFADEVNALAAKYFDDDKGFVLFAYSETTDRMQDNMFSIKGKMRQIAECAHSCMMNNPALANVMIAAADGVMQKRLAQNMMKSETPIDDQEAMQIQKPLS